MEYIKVKSSNVDRVGYNNETKELHVIFLTGAEYKYIGVPESEYLNLVGAESVGKYLNGQIKPVYPVEKVNAK